jgi:hypothetical protein
VFKASHTNLAKELVIHELNTSIFCLHFVQIYHKKPSVCIYNWKLGVPDPIGIESLVSSSLLTKTQTAFCSRIKSFPHICAKISRLVLFTKSFADLNVPDPRLVLPYPQARPLFRATAYDILQPSAPQTTRIIGGRQSLPGFSCSIFQVVIFTAVLPRNITCWLSWGDSWVRHRLRLDSSSLDLFTK